MKLKRFKSKKTNLYRHVNKNKELLISRLSLLISVIILFVAILFFTYARLESKSIDYNLINATVGDFVSGDYTIAAYVDGVKSRSIPAKDAGYYLQKVECENGANGTWHRPNWSLTVENATVQTKCYVYLTTLIAQADTTGQYATLSRYYPVGSIYQTTTNDNPNTLFGGTWVKIEGKFLLASSSSYTLGSTGGNATIKLAANQIPTLTGISGTTGGMSANVTHTHNTGMFCPFRLCGKGFSF